MISTMGPRFQVSNSEKRKIRIFQVSNKKTRCVQLFEREKRSPIKNEIIRVCEKEKFAYSFSYFFF